MLQESEVKKSLILELPPGGLSISPLVMRRLLLPAAALLSDSLRREGSCAAIGSTILGMENELGLEVVDRALHANQGAIPFVASIVDDPHDGETKLVIMFEEDGHVAVLSLDRLIEEEDISFESNKNNHILEYEAELREQLWEE